MVLRVEGMVQWQVHSVHGPAEHVQQREKMATNASTEQWCQLWKGRRRDLSSKQVSKKQLRSSNLRD